MLTAVGAQRQTCLVLFCRAQRPILPRHRKRFSLRGASVAPIRRAALDLPVAGMAEDRPRAW